MLPSAWAYCRVSTRKEEQEESLEAQCNRALKFASETGLDLRIFSEQASAKSITGRRVLSDLLAEIERLPPRQRPRYIFVTALDRLYRNVVDGMYIGHVLLQAKVAIFVAGRGEVQLDTFSNRAQFVGESLGGDAENEARSARARESWNRRRRAGEPMCNKRPYGLSLENGVDVITPGSGDWVRKAFRWYADGDGTYVIGKRMSAEAPAHTWLTMRIGPDGERISKTRSATLWEANRVGKLLRVKAYRGTVVAPELFDAVQALLSEKPKYRNERKREYPLSGVMTCVGCARHLHGGGSGTERTGSVGKIARKPLRYYTCVVCRYSIRAEILEQAFFADIGRLVADPALLERWIAVPSGVRSENAALRKELKATEALIERGRICERRDQLFSLALAASISEVDFSFQIKRLDDEARNRSARCAEIRSQLLEHEVHVRTVRHATSLLARFSEIYTSASYAAKRELVGDLTAALGGLQVSAQGLVWPARC